MAAGESYTQRFFILLEVLKHNTNADHTLSQVELVDLLAEQGIVIDRRSVKKALDEMIKLGYPIKYSQGWYFEHDFSTEELDALMSLIRCGSYFSAEDQRRLEEKIQNLGGKWYQPPESITPTKPTNPLLMHNLHVLYEAIRAGVQVNFTYGNWDIDKELHPRPNSVGKPKDIASVPITL